MIPPPPPLSSSSNAALLSGGEIAGIAVGASLGVVGSCFLCITATGYYVPWMFVSAILMSVGAGLTTTFEKQTASKDWIGYQVIFGLGLGMGMQQPGLAAQTVLNQKDVSIGISLVFFAQSLGGAIFVSIGQALFIGHLSSTLDKITGIDMGAILAAGATELAQIVPVDKLTEVLLAYNDSLVRALAVAVAVSCLMLIPALGMEWRTTKEDNLSTPASLN